MKRNPRINFYVKQFIKELEIQSSALKSILSSVLLYLISDENKGIPLQGCVDAFLHNILGIFFVLLLYSLFQSFKKGAFSPKISIKNGNTKINIFFGDLFKQAGIKIIPINDIADDKIGEKGISGNSLHGQFLLNHCPGGIERFRHEVLKQNDPEKMEKLENYDGLVHKIGTIFRIDDFYCATLTHTDLPKYIANASVSDLVYTIECVIEMANQYGEGKSVFFPLIGGGLSRINLEKERKIQLIVSAIQSKNSNVGYHGEFNIVLSYTDLESIDLKKLKCFIGDVYE